MAGRRPPGAAAGRCFWLLLVASLSFYGVCLYLGLHEGSLVIGRGLTPEQAEEATPLHPYLLMAAGIAMMAAFWLLLVTVWRTFRGAPAPLRWFVLAGCGALAVGTLQGPIQAFPAVHDLLDKGGYAGDVIVNLHAQLNMLGGLMVLLVGGVLALLASRGGRISVRAPLIALAGIVGGVAVYYLGGVGFSAAQASGVAGGRSFQAAVAALEPWSALVLVPAAVAVLVGFFAYALSAWVATAVDRRFARLSLAGLPGRFAGPIPKRVRRRKPAGVAAYELPMGIMGFPGVGWLFAGYPLVGSILLIVGPALAWAMIPTLFSPYGSGPLTSLGWKAELVWLPLSTLVSAGLLYRAHARRKARLDGTPPRRRAKRRRRGYRTRVGVAAGTIMLLLVSLPFVPAVAGVGSSTVRYSYQPRLTRDITGQFLRAHRGTIKLFSWDAPQDPYPADALRFHAAQVTSLVVRAAAVDTAAAYQLYDLDRGLRVSLSVTARSPRQLALAPAGRARARTLRLRHDARGDVRRQGLLVPHRRAAARSGNRGLDRYARPLTRGLRIGPARWRRLSSPCCSPSSSSGRVWHGPAGRRRCGRPASACFAVATGCEAAAQRAGWTPDLFRPYYLFGGCLTVAFLGAGSAWLLFPRSRRVLLVVLGLGILGAAATVMLAPVDAAALAATVRGRPPPNHALEGYAYLWAIALNALGTLFLVGGSLWAIVRHRRVAQNAVDRGRSARRRSRDRNVTRRELLPRLRR